MWEVSLHPTQCRCINRTHNTFCAAPVLYTRMLGGTATVGSGTSDLNEFGADRIYDCFSVVRGMVRREGTGL